MTRDDIIRMAQEAGITYQLVVSGWGQHWIDIPVHFERFAALVAAAERERLAAKFMEMHNAQQHRNNYWAFAARVIREEAK